MAKCTVCNSRKGKRKCKATGTFICSLCCGESRTEEKCDGCSFFKSAAISRNYRSVPYYSTQKMADSPELERIADVVELSLCQIWANDHRRVDDRTAARLVELMIDRYHFKDETPRVDTSVLEEGFRFFSQNIGENLAHIRPEQLVKVLAAVYRSIQRRTVGGTSYLQFVSQFTGIGPAM
jgi:hypothetical protein